MIVRSPKYLAGSRDAPCALQIPGVCTGIGVVPCHARDDNTGGAAKASDLSVVDGCFDCHDVFDRRRKLPEGRFLTEAEWDHYALRALQRTQDRRVAMGLLLVVGFDPNAAPKPHKIKPRKPEAERRAISHRAAPIPQRVKQPRRQQHTATGPMQRKGDTP